MSTNKGVIPKARAFTSGPRDLPYHGCIVREILRSAGRTATLRMTPFTRNSSLTTKKK
jgi:hypothetical protein